MTPFSAFYLPLRGLLADRFENGSWGYPDEVLDSGLRTCFAANWNPPNYFLSDGTNAVTTLAGLADAIGVTPDIALGGDLALLCYYTVKGMIVGEDGAMAVNTRSVSIRDHGERKRDLLIQLDLWIRNGEIGQRFDTAQRFAQWAAARVQPADYPGMNIVTPQKYNFVV